MIWIRRLIAIILGLVFVPVFLVSAVVLRVNFTLLEPGFYVEELRKAGLFAFAYDQVIPLAVDQQLRDMDVPRGLDLDGKAVSARVQRVFPAEWLETQLEGAVQGVAPYLVGDTDGFTVTVSLADRGDAALEAVRETLRATDLDALVYGELVPGLLDDALEGQMELPLGLAPSSQEVAEAIEEVLPASWLGEQMEMVLDGVGPYVVGRTDSFTVTLPLADRAEKALEVVKGFLEEADIQGFLVDNVIGPALFDGALSGVELPLGLTITKEEMEGALRQVLTDEWLGAQVAEAVDRVGPYMTGAADGFTLEVPIQERAEAAAAVAEELLGRKLDALVAELPQCSTEQLLALAQGGAQEGLPGCIPPDVSPQDLIARLDLNAGGELVTAIRSMLPPSITFTEADLRKMLEGSPDILENLDLVRRTIREGFSFDEADLRRLLSQAGGQEALDALDRVRETVRDGWSFTEADLREAMASGGGGDALADLDRARDVLGTARPLWFVLPLALALLMLLVGVLGGRRLGSRLAWAAAPLVVAASALYAAAGPVYRAVSAQRWLEARDQALAGADALEALMVEKGFSVGRMVVEDLLFGIEMWGLALALVGVGAVVLGLVLNRIASRRKTTTATP